MKPFYSLHFNARECTMKIKINDIPLTQMEISGQCSSRYPFNNLLLESGHATIRYEVLPLHGESQLHREAYLKCEVELYDLDSGYEPVSQMALYEMSPQNDSLLPCIVHEEVFQVSVPYSIIGWKRSMKLDGFQNRIKTMVLEKYYSIIMMMQSHDFCQYEDTFRERENIMGICYYLSEAEKKDRMKSIEDAIMNCTKIVPLTNLDFLEFAADGRLVRLIKEDGESSLRLMNEEAGEKTFIELWLQMKPGSSELTVI